jgi:hypothetical protein
VGESNPASMKWRPVAITSALACPRPRRSSDSRPASAERGGGVGSTRRGPAGRGRTSPRRSGAAAHSKQRGTPASLSSPGCRVGGGRWHGSPPDVPCAPAQSRPRPGEPRPRFFLGLQRCTNITAAAHRRQPSAADLDTALPPITSGNVVNETQLPGLSLVALGPATEFPIRH